MILKSIHKLLLPALACVVTSQAMAADKVTKPIDPYWNNATVYFMMTDRFANGDKSNDVNYGRKNDAAMLRNFMGGDLKGITQKINEGYFNKLGVNVLWMTPLNEQVHGYWDEDWGRSYPFHGYWIKDWTAVDPNWGTEADMKAMINAAHAKGIRVLADVVLNHTGPKTNIDVQWPDEWVRIDPLCQWKNYEQVVKCNLATSLSDIKTESDDAVALPPFLLKKWQQEGRVKEELAELDAFFERTKLPRAPKNYIVKWLTDWVRDHGLDGFRVDTAKHAEEEIWQVLKDESVLALKEWQQKNPNVLPTTKDFFMVGEVMNFGVDGHGQTPKGTRLYDFGDKQVDYFNYGFDSLINMGFAQHAKGDIKEMFNVYAKSLNSGELSGVGVMNYLVSHDDEHPFDQAREHSFDAANKLLLAPGMAQIYYGDETARNLTIKDALGDATWRSFMNWQELNKPKTSAVLTHWQKVGQFRRDHMAIGVGEHQELSAKPYVFSRVDKASNDKVVVALDAPTGKKTIVVGKVFKDGQKLFDAYSKQSVKVNSNKVVIDSPYSTVLLEQK